MYKEAHQCTTYSKRVISNIESSDKIRRVLYKQLHLIPDICAPGDTVYYKDQINRNGQVYVLSGWPY